MEKRKPTYDLAAIKAAIGSVKTLSITSSALRDAVGLGFDRSGIANVIQTIERQMFYKSMTTHADHISGSSAPLTNSMRRMERILRG